MAICTLTQTTSSVDGVCKKRKKVGNYEKPKQENKKKLELFLNKLEKDEFYSSTSNVKCRRNSGR